MLFLRSTSRRIAAGHHNATTKQWIAPSTSKSLLQHRSFVSMKCSRAPTTLHFQRTNKRTTTCIFPSSTKYQGKSRILSSSASSARYDDDDDSTSVDSSFKQNPTPDFNINETAFQTKSTVELSRALLSFGLCQIPPLVRNAESLLKLTRSVAGDTITDGILRATLFGHFCAGEDEKTIQPTISKLKEAGIGSILDFAAEDDGEEDKEKKQKNNNNITPNMQPLGSTHVVRVYDYESEAKCDRHVATFQKCIEDVSNLQSDGYAAMKVTALVNPILLERMSRSIVEAQRLFAKFDQDGDGFISKDEFQRGLHLFFNDEDVTFKEMMEMMVDPDKQSVDYITWSMSLAPRDLPKITAGCRDHGPLSMTTPTEEEVELIEKMYDRVHALGKTAAESRTRLLVDAEQARFQPAIDNLVLDLQRTYNATDTTDIPIIYNTYQCYLKDAADRLQTDVERSERHDYHFGAKLVRGAYMESERALADSLGYPSPIHDTIQDTHNCYNDSVKFLLQHSKKSTKTTEVMCATHNQETIEIAIDAMNELGIDRDNQTICFAQLLGMMDNLTYNLGHQGFRAFKYVPYGPVKMVMPYLLRRAQENSAIAGGASKELEMITGELKRRLLTKLRLSS